MVSPRAGCSAPDDDLTAELESYELNAVPRAPLDALTAGANVGHYVVERALAAGGGGIVYAAKHPISGRRVAIKVSRSDLLTDPSMVARFVREVAAVNRIRHPNIVDIYEFGELEPGRPYYVMELLEGEDLRNLLRVHGRFCPRETFELIEPICHAVHAAHLAGFIHRDIKASNVVVVEGAVRSVKLLDFGIAKMLRGDGSGQGFTAPGVSIGTAHNMAPEQIRCQPVDERSDVYALGVLIYQLLTGEYPFDARDPRQIALLHLQAKAARPSAIAPVPPSLDAVVLRCLEKNAAARFQSVLDLVNAFREAVSDAPASSAGTTVRGVGIYVEAVTKGMESDDLDDEVFEDLCNVIDTAERALATHCFAFPLRTSKTLLGVRVLDRNANESDERQQALRVVAELEAAARERSPRHPSVQVAVSWTLGEALARESVSGREFVGGPLLDAHGWTAQHTTRRS